MCTNSVFFHRENVNIILYYIMFLWVWLLSIVYKSKEFDNIFQCLIIIYIGTYYVLCVNWMLYVISTFTSKYLRYYHRYPKRSRSACILYRFEIERTKLGGSTSLLFSRHTVYIKYTKISVDPSTVDVQLTTNNNPNELLS